jgi:hypothetical protein
MQLKEFAQPAHALIFSRITRLQKVERMIVMLHNAYLEGCDDGFQLGQRAQS